MIEYINDYQDGFTYNGNAYSGDDIVVAECEIGRIVCIDEEKELCSFVESIYQGCPDMVLHFSVCTMVGMRKANESEKRDYIKAIRN